ncbi:MAG: hypothetical protein IPM26_04770 [Saprospiraceae bacterium]|nr:hypothetical protein [Saprospiraceae bacterium]
MSYNVYSNCSFTKCFEITPFNVIANVKDICLQGTGSISLEVSRGAEPYTYKWSNDRSGLPAITGKNSGIYTVTITDTNGCSMVREHEIKIKKLDLTGIISNPTLCSLDETSDIEVMVHNGKEPYLYINGARETHIDKIYT